MSCGGGPYIHCTTTTTQNVRKQIMAEVAKAVVPQSKRKVIHRRRKHKKKFNHGNEQREMEELIRRCSEEVCRSCYVNVSFGRRN